MPRGLPGISTGMVPEPKAQLNRFTPRSESDVRKAYTSEWHEKLQSRYHAQTSLILACWSWPVPTCFSNYSKVIVDQLPVAYCYVNATQLYLSLRGWSGCNAVWHYIKSIIHWMIHEKLLINDEKRECIPIGTRQQLCKLQPVNVLVGSSVINPCSNVKHLGCWLGLEPYRCHCT